jgi:hypothetical protein
MNLYNEFLEEWSHKWFQYIKENPNEIWNYNILLGL